MKKIAIALICSFALMGCESPSPKTYNKKEKNCRCNVCTCVDGNRCGPNCNCKPAK